MLKRFQITLTKENVEEAHRLLKALGLSKYALSPMMDDQLANMLPVLSKMAEYKQQGKQLGFEEILGTVFQTVGDALQEK